MVKNISILGSTGSIGRQTLEVAEHLGINVTALAAGQNVELLMEQIVKFQPQIVSVQNADCAAQLADRMKQNHVLSEKRIEVFIGEQGLIEVATESNAEMVVAAISGAVGLPPVLAAIEEKKDIALANKETMVMAGKLVMDRVKQNGNILIPVDSEHSAIFQCMLGGSHSEVHKLILTASGGPFRNMDHAQLADITPEQAVKHPVWNMGRKISIDSATMMNKGLEVIEAARLYHMAGENIEVLVHPQSIIHSMVEYNDFSVIAQLGIPDMKMPIQYALTYPGKVNGPMKRLDLAAIGALTFERPDFEKFPCLRLAYEALHYGGTMPAVLNAANEAAVELFLAGRIRFLDISRLIAAVMEKQEVASDSDLGHIFEADRQARKLAIEWARQ